MLHGSRVAVIQQAGPEKRHIDLWAEVAFIDRLDFVREGIGRCIT
ncbi:hypothetical protein X765_20685 [Mesorhizobium sp. LSHC440B00]|nr:hypothetical protein X765_20685 [Mesorhizobium sp. LSHC440B00]ESX30155.1 hypothetical protein X764_31205 [Mesorhizobium sp. LSHC440A00]ESX37791.1 hypothetical protein X763_13590 [Mesorhizobium sp. LSHC432A00]